MKNERYQWLAAVISAHKDRRVYGRTRLQKTIRLLQSLGLPTQYSYMSHFYGPYSEELQGDINLLESLRFVEEKPEQSVDGSPYYIIEAKDVMPVKGFSKFSNAIHMLETQNTVTLELAATYLSFREMGSNRAESLKRLKEKKGAKCDQGRDREALELLKTLGLPG